MIYKKLGKTGYHVSRLGFGAMRLPELENGDPDPEESVRIIHRAFELGVNYIDTAVMYCRHKSQGIVGDALRLWRDRVSKGGIPEGAKERIYVSTKNHYKGEDEKAWWKNLEDSLRLLDVDCIDVYNIHGINGKTYEGRAQGPNGLLAWMQKAKDQGLIANICASFHDTADGLRTVIRGDDFASITLQYNLLDRQLEPVIPEMAERGIGIVVMGPVGGGRLGVESSALKGLIAGAESTPEVALRFVLANPHVATTISGMSTMEQVEENCKIAKREEPLTNGEQDQVMATLERLKGLAELYCTGCNYCMPCPSGVDIPRVFEMVNQARVYGLEEAAKKSYAQHLVGKASYCIVCGTCEPKCPQNIPITRQIQEAAEMFDPAYGQMALRIVPAELDEDGVRCIAAFHNISNMAQEAQAKLSATGGLVPQPDELRAKVEQPFKLREEEFTLAGALTGPAVAELNAHVADAAGERDEVFHLTMATAVPCGTLETLREAAESHPPLALEREAQVATGFDALNNPFALRAWAGYDEAGFRALFRIDTEGGNQWALDVFVDARFRAGVLAPGFPEGVAALRVEPDGSDAKARVIRGSLELDEVKILRAEGPDGGTEICVNVPWPALGGRETDKGDAMGFDAMLVIMDGQGAETFRAFLNANPRVHNDGRTATLFFA